MTDFSGLTAEAQKIMLALEYGAKIQWSEAFSAAKDLVEHPVNALTDGSAVTVMIDASDLMKVIGEWVPGVGVAGQVVGFAATVEPLAVEGFGLMLSMGVGNIPAVTTETETNIEDQLGPNHGDRGY
jgi:hypothetical protein